MPAALPTQEPAARTWWNLNRSPSSKDLRHAYQHEKPRSASKSGKLNSLASAIGLKSKKHSPTLAIQEPPATLVQYVSTTPVSPASSASRPPKSVASSRSRVDSIEPRTPVDYQQRDPRHHSLLTLSDSDPFAGRPMIAVPVPQLPHLPSDPNRLSAYSNPSITEFVQKKADAPTFNRVSYASSSSNSHNHALDIPASPIPTTRLPELRQLKAKRSAGSLQFKRPPPPEPLHRQTSVTPSMTSSSSHSKAGSSSTVVGPQRQSQPKSSGPTRPKLRIRGLTDSGPPARAGFFVEEHPSLRKVSPKPSYSDIPSSCEPLRVVKRQASTSRIQPPTAPPKQQLPAPPSAPLSSLPPVPSHPVTGSTLQRKGLGGRASASSSSLSFASSESITGSPYGVADRDKRSSQRSAFAYEPDSPISFVQPSESRTAPSSPRTLKKALSHQSLTRVGLASPVSPPLPVKPKSPPSMASDSATEKAMRKQRSFHHPRLPIPPIPLPIRTSSLANSKVFPSSNIPESVSSRRGSTATSISSRRRLFSNSSRPATSHHPPTTPEDDTLSVFSLRSDTDSHLMPFQPWINRERQQLPSSSSFWDETGPDVPSSPVHSTVDFYTPQAIISHAELAQIEASVDSQSTERSTTRTRGYSLMSSSTVLSDTTQESDVIPIGLSPPPASSSRPSSSRPSSRPSSARPSSKQVSMRMSGTPVGSAASSSRPQSAVSSPAVSSPTVSSPTMSNSDDYYQQLMRAPSLMSTAQVASRVALPEITSLPPPPRRRKPTITTTNAESGSSSAGASSSSRPPSGHSLATRPPSSHSTGQRSPSAHSINGAPHSSTSSASLATATTPPLRTSPTITPIPSRAPSVKKSASMRSKFSVEKSLHRRSIMRKPSFLDIDDDTDLESDSANIMDECITGSFLDLARESFDTVRTDR